MPDVDSEHLEKADRHDEGGHFSATYSAFVVLVLTLVYIFNFVDRQILAILVEPIKAELRISDTQIGFVSGIAFALFYTVVGVPVGWLADRTSRVRLVAAACALWSLFCAAGGMATNFAQLVASRVGVAIGEAGGSPPSHSIISDYFPPERRGRALGIFSLGPSIGPYVGSAIGGGVAAMYGWRAAFVAVALPGLLLAALLLLFVREPKRGRFDVGSLTSPVPFATAVGNFVRDPVLLLTSLGTGFAAFAGYGMLAWTPAFLMRAGHMSLAEVAVYYSLVIGLVSATGTVASGWIVDRLGKQSPSAYSLVPSAAYLLSLPFFLAALWAPDWRLSLALLTVPNFLTSMFLTASVALVQNRVSPSERALSSSLLIFALNFIGLGGGPLFVGIVSDSVQSTYGDRSLVIGLAALAPVFLLTAAVYFSAAIMTNRRPSHIAAVSARTTS